MRWWHGGIGYRSAQNTAKALFERDGRKRIVKRSQFGDGCWFWSIQRWKGRK
jgi:hypothetical protein